VGPTHHGSTPGRAVKGYGRLIIRRSDGNSQIRATRRPKRKGHGHVDASKGCGHDHPSDDRSPRVQGSRGRQRRVARLGRQLDPDRSVEHAVVRKILPVSTSLKPRPVGPQRGILPAQGLSGRRTCPRCRLRLWRYYAAHRRAGWPRRSCRWRRLRRELYRPRQTRSRRGLNRERLVLCRRCPIRRSARSL
jgi:hypothetical protein